MKPSIKRSLLLMLIAPVVFLAGLPFTPVGRGLSFDQGDQPESYDVHTYLISNLSTKEERTAIATKP